MYSSPFPASETAPKGRGKAAKRASGGRGGRGGGGGREAAASMSNSDSALTGVAVHVEGLGPDAPAVPISIAKGTFSFDLTKS